MAVASLLSETDASLLDDLRALVEPETRGDPQSPLLWTCKSLRKLSQSLRDMGHTIGRTLVGELLHKLDYRLQANRKTREGSHHPDRDAQFHYINDRVKDALAAGEPAISVDTKKKELVGDFKNAGREWRPKGSPEEVRVHDFVIPELGRAVPYGVYDIADNAGWVSVGIAVAGRKLGSKFIKTCVYGARQAPDLTDRGTLLPRWITVAAGHFRARPLKSASNRHNWVEKSIASGSNC